MKTKEELKKIYDRLNESEKYGIQFGLFPAKLMELSKEEVVALIDLRGEIEKNDINKRG